MPSAAPLAALERRREAAGGGVARVWGLGEECRSALASLSEADRLTVATDDDDMEALRDERRAGVAGPSAAARVAMPVRVAGSDAPPGPRPLSSSPPPPLAAAAAAVGVVWMFMLESRQGGCVSQAEPAVNAERMQAWLPKQERAQAAAGGGRRGGVEQADWGEVAATWLVVVVIAVAVAAAVVVVVVMMMTVEVEVEVEVELVELVVEQVVVHRWRASLGGGVVRRRVVSCLRVCVCRPDPYR